VALANLGAKADARDAYDALLAIDPDIHPERWAELVSPVARTDYERSQLVEGMWLASGLARDEGAARPAR